MAEQRTIVIIGAGGHATSVADVAVAAGFRLSCFIDPARVGQTHLGVLVLAALDQALSDRSASFAIAVGDNFLREKIWRETSRQLQLNAFPALIHPRAHVSSFSAVGPGSVVMAGATIGANTKVGNFCIVNTQAALDHDNYLGDFASIAPGAVTGGGVTLGERAAIGIGAAIKHNVSIGADVVVGAQSYLNKDSDGPCVMYGTPARLIRVRELGEPYLD